MMEQYSLLNGEHIQVARDKLQKRTKVVNRLVFLARLHQNYTQTKNEQEAVASNPLYEVVPGDGIEPPTRGFSVFD